MNHWCYGRAIGVLLILLSSLTAAGQQLPSADVSLDRLSLAAGISFSGTVMQIEQTAADSKPATVRVMFRVDEAGKGCKAGDLVTIEEWAELWVRGDRYQVGQRMVMFLYPPSQTGLSSPVAGDLSIFQIGADGLLKMTPLQARLFGQNVSPTTQSGAVERERVRGSPPNLRKQPRIARRFEVRE